MLAYRQTGKGGGKTQEIKFIGTINDVDHSCWVDGTCRIKINNLWIVAEYGGERPRGYSTEVRGELTGISFSNVNDPYIGKQAEVYAKVVSDNLLTIYGDKKYYIKLVSSNY